MILVPTLLRGNAYFFMGYHGGSEKNSLTTKVTKNTKNEFTSRSHAHAWECMLLYGLPRGTVGTSNACTFLMRRNALSPTWT